MIATMYAHQWLRSVGLESESHLPSTVVICEAGEFSQDPWLWPLPSDRQHPSYGDCLEVKREYYQNCAVLDCVTPCSQLAEYVG